VPPKKQEYWETPTGVKPHDSFVDVSDNDSGLAIITRGTPEHEVIDAKGRPIAITLMRAIGWLSRGDGPYRRGNAGPPMPTPDAQMQGTFVYNYSIFPHGGTWEDAEVYREALQFNTPPTGIFTDRWSHSLFKEFPHASSNLPNEMSFFTVEPDCFVVTATKQAEDNSGMIIRVCNLGTKEQTGTIIFSKSPTKVWRTNLAEREQEELVGQPVQGIKNAAKITLKLRAKEIGTIKVQ
jgi:alpha-mannosidase